MKLLVTAVQRVANTFQTKMIKVHSERNVTLSLKKGKERTVLERNDLPRFWRKQDLELNSMVFQLSGHFS